MKTRFLVPNDAKHTRRPAMSEKMREAALAYATYWREAEDGWPRGDQMLIAELRAFLCADLPEYRSTTNRGLARLLESLAYDGTDGP